LRRFLIPLLLVAGCGGPAPGDLIIHNARIGTGDETKPWAKSLVVREGRVTALDRVEEARRTIDAEGALVTPGFIDSHLHLLEGGRRLASVQLRDANSKAEFVRRIAEFTGKVRPGGWILGGDWDHTQWGGELPSRDWIDAVTPNHPVWVQRLDGHMGLANSAAMRLARIGEGARQVAGGTIVRAASGRPTGVFKDNAMALISAAIPAPTVLDSDRALDAAMAYVASFGVTSVQHMGSWEDLAILGRARKEGRLRTRVYAAVPLDSYRRLADHVKEHGRGDEWLRTGMLKGFVDGSLGSHTAAFEPYADQPADRGFFVNTPNALYQWISGADRVGLQVAVHAIGDRANRTLLDIYERVARESGTRGRRFRIEHAQHLRPADIPRFASLGVIASMQPYHAIDDGRWADRAIGARRGESSYAFQSLLAARARLAFGSDWFVAPPSIAEGLYAAVTRRTLDDRNPQGWVPAQKITLEQALRAYTKDAAYASFEEHDKGTLAPGMLADIAVWDRDLTTIPPEQIRNAGVRFTFVGGEMVYSK
jgi:hypothetical protein